MNIPVFSENVYSFNVMYVCVFVLMITTVSYEAVSASKYYHQLYSLSRLSLCVNAVDDKTSYTIVYCCVSHSFVYVGLTNFATN